MTIENSIFDLDIYSEICCDDCNEIIHNHFDCPICEAKYAGTNIYGELGDILGTLPGYDNYLECEKCDAKFEPLDYDNLYLCKWRLVEDA